ncbi:MAG TPA: PAS domain S-box protein [Dongiaceae bacterium]|nr:PAS domain S-box protein [Dongiaceae bacterium]
MKMEPEVVAAEVLQLQHCINDLVGILALPAMWLGSEPSRIVQSLLDSLAGMLHLDLVYLRLNHPIADAPWDMMRLPDKQQFLVEQKNIREVLGAWSDADLTEWPERLAFGTAEFGIAPFRLGLQGEIGILIAGSARQDFPRKTERLLLSVAANQATIGLQGARHLSEQRSLAKELDERVAERTAELAAINEQLRQQISERERVEESARDQEALLRQLFDSIAAEVTVCTPEGEIVLVNRTCVERTGRSFEEHRNWKDGDVLYHEDLPRAQAAWRKAVASGGTYEAEVRARRADGSYRWIHSNGFPVRNANGRIFLWCSLHLDIHDRKQAEEALAASERKLDLVINTVPGLVWSADVNGAAEFFNQNYLDYVGLSGEEMRGAGWIQPVHPDDRQPLASAWARMMATRQAGEAEGRLRRFDGEYRWFLFRTNPQFDDAGNVIKWFGVNVDIEDRKRAEEALRASEFKMRQLTEAIPEMLWTATPEGKTDYRNRRMLEYTGAIASDVSGMDWAQILHPDDVDRMLRTWQVSVSTGAPYQVEARTYNAAEGTYRWCLSTALPLRDEAGKILKWHGTCLDIHDRKLAEESLAASERNLNAIINTLPAMVWAAHADGSAEFVNQHYLDYVGLSTEEIRGWRWTVAVHPDDLEPLVENWKRIIGTGRGGASEARMRRFDGEYRWFLLLGNPEHDEAGNVTRWFGVNIDIEDRKRAEEALRASEHNLRRMTETIPQMLWSATAGGAIDYCNSRLLEYSGLAMEDIRDDGWTKLLHPDDVEQTARIWQACVASGEPYQVEVRTLRASDGSYRWGVTNALPLRDDDGRILKWHGTCVDLHDWKQAQEELREIQAELAHMTRATTMGQLTASIAHELNQPLAGIITNASTCLRMLAADPPNVSGARETARRTIRDGNRASEVISRLRDLFKKKAAVFEAVDMNTVAQEVIALTSNELQRSNVNLRMELAEDLPPVTGDRVQLQQVILNLILNAAEAMLETGGREKELTIITEHKGEDSVRLAVKDVGMGFDPATVERLFNPFYTTKSNGMGIGLSVSRTIIENHQGHLSAELNDGPGATFWFSVPYRSQGERDGNSFSRFGAARMARAMGKA